MKGNSSGSGLFERFLSNCSSSEVWYVSAARDAQKAMTSIKVDEQKICRVARWKFFLWRFAVRTFFYLFSAWLKPSHIILWVMKRMGFRNSICGHRRLDLMKLSTDCSIPFLYFATGLRWWQNVFLSQKRVTNINLIEKSKTLTSDFQNKLFYTKRRICFRYCGMVSR